MVKQNLNHSLMPGLHAGCSRLGWAGLGWAGLGWAGWAGLGCDGVIIIVSKQHFHHSTAANCGCGSDTAVDCFKQS